MRKQDIKPGDEVRVFPGRWRRVGKTPEGGYPGTVTGVARKYATAAYTVPYADGTPGGTERTVEFDMQTGRERGQDGTYGALVKTPAMAVRDALQAAALASIKEAGFEIRLGHRPSPELIIAVAVAIEAFGQED